MRVFVAGAAGAIGQQLLPQLTAAGHQVTATTRSPGKLELLRGLGAEAVVVDGLDAAAVGEAVARSEPEVVVHQMTSLAGATSLRRFDQTFALTNRLRTEGTDHLLAASAAAGVRRFIAQSYTGWTNPRSGGPVKDEGDPLDPAPPAAQRETLAAIRHLERAVPAAAPMQGIVLRYGSFYGPGASDEFVGMIRKRRVPVIGDGAGIWSFLHIRDAAAATVAALDHGEPGVYNVVDDEPASVAVWLPLGQWLPEPLLTDDPLLAGAAAADPGSLAEQADSLSMAFLLLLERLSPVERAVFLLHDVFGYPYEEVARIVGKGEDNCRQLALRARRHVGEGKPRFEASRRKREELAARFFEAVGHGDMEGLVTMLAADAVVYGDSGGTRPSWPRPIAGRDHVGRLLAGLAQQIRQVGIVIRPAGINGQPGAMFVDPAGRLVNVFVLDIADGQVQAIRSVINPDKLRHLGPLADIGGLRRRLHPGDPG
jgi:2-alkyl-3-oxoalkanoate reductase